MFTKRVSKVTCETAGDRKLSVNMQKMTGKTQTEQMPADEAIPPATTCENGVCSLNWKPRRPAA